MPVFARFPQSSEPGHREAIAVGLMVTVLVHLAFIGWQQANASSGHARTAAALTEPMAVEFVMEPERDDMRYVRAVSGIAERTPAQTINISDRDQQAAQPESPQELSPDNTPVAPGDMPDSNRLVQGDPRQQPDDRSTPESGGTAGQSPLPTQRAAPAQPPVSQPSDQATEAPARALAQAPVASEGERAQLEVGESPDDGAQRPLSERSTEAVPPAPRPTAQPADGNATVSTPPQGAPTEGPQPRPRPRVERDTSFGPIKENRRGAIQVGQLAFDSKYSEFGEYWTRVAEVIEGRWRNLVYNTRSVPLGGFRVVVAFDINRDGNVENLRIESSNAGRLAETISMDAIQGEAPFFPWTADMILTMGERTQCAIHFFY